MPIDPQQIAQRIIDTIARTQGDSSNSSGESLVVSERVIRDRHVRGGKETKLSTKVGYVYRKKISSVSALICANTPPPTPNPQNYPPESPPYNPVPAGQSFDVNIRVTPTTSSTDQTIYYSDGSSSHNHYDYNESLISSYNHTFTLDSSDTLHYQYDPVDTYYPGAEYGNYSIRTTISYVIYINNSPVAEVRNSAIENNYGGGTPGEDGQFHGGTVTAITILIQNGDLVVNRSPNPINPAPDPNPSDPNPDNPPSPDPSYSYEFWYNSAIAAAPIKLKALSVNQPLEASPYLIHQAVGLSYAVLKYGNADNDGGSSNDWCKISLFAIKGTKKLSVTETVYPWAQESTALSKLKSARTLFYAIAGSKTKLANINIGSLITAGKLDAKLRCFTHRNLSNLRKTGSSFFVYVVDPTLINQNGQGSGSNTEYGNQLISDSFYETFGAITHDLVNTEKLTVFLRCLEIKPNPNFSGTEDCQTNPQYLLLEKTSKRIKNFKVKGLNSTDSSIKILTLNCGVV